MRRGEDDEDISDCDRQDQQTAHPPPDPVARHRASRAARDGPAVDETRGKDEREEDQPFEKNEIARDHLDAIVAPTGGPAWTIDLVNGDHFIGASSTPAAVAGYPSITVPAGDVFGLPVGMAFIGRAWSEARLVGLAYAYEQATKRRIPPRLLPSAILSPAGH